MLTRWNMIEDLEIVPYEKQLRRLGIQIGRLNLRIMIYMKFLWALKIYVALLTGVLEPWIRETGRPERGLGAVLPYHSPNRFKMLLDTTYHIDYVPPYDYQPYVTLDPAGYSVVHRKCHSQFCDTADYRRHGINTWQDESGVYANADLRQKVFPVVNPIPTNVEEEKP
nr:PREDICTED: uncharacterized protein C9orf135 homolog isoform X1 [Anolis carolinensis]XP_016846503.1 PREDICTED: uncharacterized protein C9orf135 homolog isoform X1 [Anolis carolinensis]XP_016846504.1 PREDICTED: uncharacterized protein C9orf135 homolog isoform X1 [Anolis carolinensis]|eukprot:XP_016846502.1 PREDICTED: uncharacterized protein C9orf135 homolog isoform X1 [Anolis carolinensis]